MKNVLNLMKTPQFWAAGLLIAVSANPAFAQNLDPIVSMLTTVIGYLTGNIGKSLAAIAFIAAGIAMFTGRLNWPWFFMILVGIVLVFSAVSIVGGF